jgi:hypothetical protein
MAKWTVWVEATRPDGLSERIEIITLERNLSSLSSDDFGVRLAEAKDLFLKLQSYPSRDQVRQASMIEQTCNCGSRRSLHDYLLRQVETLFGRVTSPTAALATLRLRSTKSAAKDRLALPPELDINADRGTSDL